MKRKYVVKVSRRIVSAVVEAESYQEAKQLAEEEFKDFAIYPEDFHAEIRVDLSEATEVNDCYLIIDENSGQTEVYSENGHCLNIYGSFDEAVIVVLEGSNE